jgi:histidine triad (HIT) family protein
MTDTIFGKIIAGQIPCHKVYEDDRVLAFLDVNPLTRGHTLVIPKEPAATLDKLSDESAAALGRALPRICRAVIAATGVSEYNVLENNGPGAHQTVFHVHFHIIPRPGANEGLGLRWSPQALDKSEAAELVKLITGALQKAP